MTWKQMKRAWSRAEKNRMMTLQQLLGLAGGLACTILIYLWVADEKQMDRFGRNDDRLFQVLENNPGENGIATSEQTPGRLAAALAAEMTEVEKSASVVPVSSLEKQAIISAGDTEIYADASFAGKDFFQLFAYPITEGNPEHALEDRNHIAISKTLALKLFHRTEGLIGKTVTCNQQDTAARFIISAVFDNSAKTSSAAFDVVIPYDQFLDKNQRLLNWHNVDPQTFVLLKPGTPVEAFNQKLKQFLQQKNPGSKATLFAQNYGDKYLHNHYKNGKPSGGRIEYVTLFSVVAFAILFIACVNFISLASAFATDKIKSAGDKKATRSLPLQLLTEPMGMCIVAILLALLLVYFSLPAFNSFTGKKLSIQPNAGLILIISGITALTGFASGTYPVMYFSGSVLRFWSTLQKHAHQSADLIPQQTKY